MADTDGMPRIPPSPQSSAPTPAVETMDVAIFHMAHRCPFGRFVRTCRRSFTRSGFPLEEKRYERMRENIARIRHGWRP